MSAESIYIQYYNVKNVCLLVQILLMDVWSRLETIHGSCWQDIVRDKWIYRCDTYDKTMARDIHGWMPFTENVMVCDICFPIADTSKTSTQDKHHLLASNAMRSSVSKRKI